MKKVWIYKRKNIKGYWVGWYESGKHKAKVLSIKELAEHYKNIKYEIGIVFFCCVNLRLDCRE